MMHAGTLQAWSEQVENEPAAIALISPEGQKLSRRELDERSDSLAGYWRTEDIRTRRLFLMKLKNGFDWMIAYLACLKLGVIVVPLDAAYTEEETLEIARDLRVQSFWDGEILHRVNRTNPRRLRSPEIVMGKLTSGSTGKPKVVFFSDAEMVADGWHIIRAMKICSGDVNLGMIPWGHSYGLGSIVYPLLLQGTCTTWTDTPFPDEIAKVCASAAATVFPSVPTVIRALGNSACDPEKLSSLRLVLSAGARLEPAIAGSFRAAFGITPHNFYGSTETGGICFDETGESALTGRSVGKPMEGVTIIEGRGRRFYVRSDAVYTFGNRYSKKGCQAKHLAADYGYLDHGGELVLEKRVKGIIKIGARRISPAEVEVRLEALESVSQAIVFGIETKGETVMAAAVETSLSRSALVRKIKEELPQRLRPKKTRCFEMFPVNSRGKVDLNTIKQAFVSS